MTIKDHPHYTISAKTLADWIEGQPEKWWSVDGDLHLNGVVDFPCPSDELVPAIRKVGKDLLLRAKNPGSAAHGEVIAADRLDEQAIADRRHDKILRLSWADFDDEWLLLDDEPMTA